MALVLGTIASLFVIAILAAMLMFKQLNKGSSDVQEEGGEPEDDNDDFKAYKEYKFSYIPRYF